MAITAVEDPQRPESTEDRQQIVEILDRYRTGLSSRQSREGEWYVAREFLKGNHYVAWVRTRLIGNPDRDERQKRKPKLVYNKCRVIAETILAYLLKSDPVFGVVAQTGEPEDQSAASVGQKILYHYWGSQRCNEKLERTGTWAMISGKGFWKVGWNPQIGPKVPIIERRPFPPPMPPPEIMEESLLTGMPLPPEYIEPVMQDVVVGEEPAGDVTIEVVSPFEIVVDPGAENLDEAQWVIHATMLPIDEVQAQYPAKAAKIRDHSNQMNASLVSRVLDRFGASSMTRKDQLKRVLVIEYWARRSRKYPEGRRVVMTEEAILEAGPTPKGYDEIPFAEWVDRPIPGEFWADGTLRDLVPLNKELNKRLSQAVDIANKFRVKYVAVIGSIDESQIRDVDGEIIEHQPGPPPQAVNPPPIPDAIPKLITMCESAMEDTSGAVAVLQGKVGGEVRSGRQVAYQGQYGETRIALLAKHLARFLERAGKLVLMQVAANVTEQRIGKIIGKGRQMEAFQFIGADIRDNTDVSVETDSLLGFSKTERFDKLIQMADRKVITPDQFLSKMEMEDVNPILEAIAQDRNNAIRENESWKQGGQAREPRYFDNHNEHLDCHNTFRKSTAYESLPPEIREAVDQHCAFHEDQLAPPPPEGMPGEPPLSGEPPPPPLPEIPEEESVSEFEGPPQGQTLGPPSVEGSGQELAEGLPPVPRVPDFGPENQH